MRPRSLLRLVLLVGWTLLFVPPPFVLALVSLGSRRLARRTGPLLMQLFSAGVCRIIGIHIERSGPVPAPKAALLTPNHWGYVDVFVLASLCRTVFVSRADLGGWPVVGRFARMGGTLFVDRQRRRDAVDTGDEIEVALREGRRVTAFLEGGVSPGRSVLPFKSSLLAAAVRAEVPCVPVAIRYSLPLDPTLDPGEVVAWIDANLGRHFWRLLGTRRIDVRVEFLPPRLDTDRKRLARELTNDVATAFGAR